MKKLLWIMQVILLLPVVPILGALKVKSGSESATKWSENAGRSADTFATGAESAAEDWARNTAQAADTYGQAITQGNIKERFRRGVTRAGAAKFARKIRDVARDRFAPGVAAAQTDYQSGVEPFLQTLSSLTLSPRKPRGDPANYNRVQEVGKALNARRLAQLGSGGG